MSIEQVVGVISDIFEIKKDQLFSPPRDHPWDVGKDARSVAILFSRKYANATLRELREAFCCSTDEVIRCVTYTPVYLGSTASRLGGETSSKWAFAESEIKLLKTRETT